MSFVWQTAFAVILALSALKAYELISAYVLRIKARGKDIESPPSPPLKAVKDENHIVSEATKPLSHVVPASKDMQLHKELYHKLQNLEKYPEVLPRAWDSLTSLLSETLSDALKQPDEGILSLGTYSKDRLEAFLKTENDKVMSRYEDYIKRRKSGGPREMFSEREEAEWWLKQAAPVKYVDGAWLGHINKVSTPFALRSITKNAWQVMSEELGDGDLEKNHVHVYRDLMRDIGAGLPEGTDEDFVHPRHDLNQARVWKAALAQLLVSLFPHDFLPEALGFNMAYECLPLHLMKTVKELEELKLNAYYFVLHVSIDNADSGHSAMAMEAAAEYIEHVRATQGDEAAELAWKRVQAGFILAEGLPTTPESGTMKRSAPPPEPKEPTELESALLSIFKAKAPVAHKLHCNSRLKIGRHSLVDWLEPKAFAERQWQMDFLHDLSNRKPWVVKGHSDQSKLIKELAWEGKMFGSFTEKEVDTLKNWIDSQSDGSFDQDLYWSWTGRENGPQQGHFHEQRSITTDYPVLRDSAQATAEIEHVVEEAPALGTDLSFEFPNVTKHCIDLYRFLPLWFAHPCLLECFVNIPAWTANRSVSAIVRLLRAQYGFEDEGPGVAGMDEVRRTDATGLLELGQEIIRNIGRQEPANLDDILKQYECSFATTMLHMSMRPLQYGDILLGMCYAFIGVHEVVSHSDLLRQQSKEILQDITRRERESIKISLADLKSDEVRYAEFCKGFNCAKAQILGMYG